MDLVPFQPEHLFQIVPAVASRDDLARFAAHYRPVGPAWTGVEAGAIAGCGGIVIGGAVGKGWVILSYPVRAAAVHRVVRHVIEREFAAGTVRRIEARALEEWDGARRWLERLGFQAVGRDGTFRVYLR